MVLSRLFSARSFKLARQISTLTRNGRKAPSLVQQVKPMPARTMVAKATTAPGDLSVRSAVLWLVLGACPITLAGFYVTKLLKDMIEDVEAGHVIPGPKTVISNDEWYDMKQELLAAVDEDDEEDEEEETTPASEESINEESQPLDVEPEQEIVAEEEEFVVVETPAVPEPAVQADSKDTIIFVGPPDKE